MTYVIGWKSETSVFISGDMAITTTGENVPELSKQLSSFQEKHFKSGDKKIEESLQKVLNLDGNIIFGFAGDVKLSSDFANNLSLRMFQEKINKPEDFAKIIERSLEDCVSEKNRPSVQFVFGIMINDVPTLFSYNAFNNCQIFHHKESVQIGSLTNSHLYPQISAGIASLFIQGKLPDARMLACVNSLVQSYGVHDNLIEYFGVGGAILGVSISSSGISWQDNTIYVIYEELNNEMSIINLSIKDGVTLTRDFHGDYHAFINTQNSDSPSKFDFKSEEQIQEIKKHINSDIYKYLVFLRKKYRQITILERNENSPKSAYAKIEIENEKNTLMALNQGFMQKLVEVPKEKDNAIPFSFAFLQDIAEGSVPGPMQSIQGEFGPKK